MTFQVHFLLMFNVFEVTIYLIFLVIRSKLGLRNSKSTMVTCGPLLTTSEREN